MRFIGKSEWDGMSSFGIEITIVYSDISIVSDNNWPIINATFPTYNLTTINEYY